MQMIIGPCAIESRDHALRLAEMLCIIKHDLIYSGYAFDVIFKASYSKPNRSNGESFAGVGMGEGLRILQEVRETSGLRVTSDVHTPSEARTAGEVLDIIQIPHQLCKNTPIVLSAAATKKPVSIKKGTFYDPRLFHMLVKKVRSVGNTAPVIAIERGNHFGYGDTVVDMRNLGLLDLTEGGNRDPSVITCLDATHPGAGPVGARALSGAGVAAGAQMLFLEVHDTPEQARCDGQCALPLEGLLPFLRKMLQLKQVMDTQ